MNKRDGVFLKKRIILGVAGNSVAESLGILAGDILLTINGEPVIDVIDEAYYDAQEELTLAVMRKDGTIEEVTVEKDAWDPLGLDLGEALPDGMKQCANRCIFCFVDQLPRGLRPSMYVKDDDWRMSLIMGNYVTLTNVSDGELDRIIRRKAGPLNISVHATEPKVRERMLEHKNAGRLMDQLNRLGRAGIAFHTQAVLCPGINDGKVLEKTISDLACLYPSARSLALVPVGLTGHREGLHPLSPYTRQTAREVLSIVDQWQKHCVKRLGDPFVQASDEFYLRAEMPVPLAEAYGGFDQVENGVGMLAKFREEFLCELERLPARRRAVRVSVATGVSACGIIKELAALVNRDAMVYAVENGLFGSSVTVAGLIAGQDLIRQLKGRALGEQLLLPGTMLREREDVFLDDMTVAQVRAELGVPLRVLPVDGGRFARALCGLYNEKERTG